MTDQAKAFTKAQMKLLSSSRGLRCLLMQDKPDFNAALRLLEHEQELMGLQAELIRVQNWVLDNDKRLLVLVEGREFAGKGEAVRLFTDHLNPQHMRLVALQKPTIKERQQWYFKRYISHLPEPGEMVFFDRSWYNRALVEPVHGFCTQKEYKRFMSEVNHFERMLSEDGMIIIKFYLTISRSEQKRRVDLIRQNPLRSWQLTKVDLEAVDLYDRYTEYKEALFDKTNTAENPWHRIDANKLDKAILKAMRIILKEVPYNG